LPELAGAVELPQPFVNSPQKIKNAQKIKKTAALRFAGAMFGKIIKFFIVHLRKNMEAAQTREFGHLITTKICSSNCQRITRRRSSALG
jgi:hypothetical protein